MNSQRKPGKHNFGEKWQRDHLEPLIARMTRIHLTRKGERESR